MYKNYMNKLRVLIIFMTIFSSTGATGGTPEQRFWKWFEKNQAKVFNFEVDRERIFDKLSGEMKKVNPDLTFEFGPVMKNGVREFVISAGGIKTAFSFVESLYNSAPKLDKWKIVKFRPRRIPLNDIEYGGKSISVKDVHFQMFKDGAKVGIVLFFNGYNEKEHDIFGNIGFLLLDEALGEFDIETKVGFIEFHNRESKLFQGARPLSQLSSTFDNYINSK